MQLPLVLSFFNISGININFYTNLIYPGTDRNDRINDRAIVDAYQMGSSATEVTAFRIEGFDTEGTEAAENGTTGAIFFFF